MKGVNFSGSSKSDIVSTFEKELDYGSGKADREKFLELMLKASDICTRNKEKLNKEISEILK